MWRSVVVGIVLSLSPGFGSETVACPICIGFPSRTDTDVLLESRCVMLAQQDSADPFRFAPGTVLKGVYDGSNFDLLVDSATQHMLQVHPEFHVWLVQETPEGPWRSLGVMNPAREALMRRIVMVGPTWTGSDAAKLRVDFFVSLVGHEEDRIRELAYLELGRAPYSVVRQLGRTIPRDCYEPMLRERRYFEWRGLAILLLAQSDSEADRQFVRDSFHAAEHYAVVTNLAAWTAAAIELDPAATIALIEEKYFLRADRSQEELQAIFQALSMHGSLEAPELRERIVACYGKLLESHPEFAPQVAEDLSAWRRFDLSKPLARILDQRKSSLDPSAIGKLQKHLRFATIDAASGRVHD